MTWKQKAVLVFAILGWVFILGRGCAKPKPPIQALSPGETERITVDPGSHTISIQTPSGLRTETLPDKPSTFDVNKDGTVKVSVSQFGFEHHLFVSGLMADKFRIGLGMDGVYYKCLDLGMGLADSFTGSWPIVFAKLTYNVKGNVQAGIVYQSNQYIGGIVSVRLF